VELTCSW